MIMKCISFFILAICRNKLFLQGTETNSRGTKQIQPIPPWSCTIKTKAVERNATNDWI